MTITTATSTTKVADIETSAKSINNHNLKKKGGGGGGWVSFLEVYDGDKDKITKITKTMTTTMMIND